MVEVNDFKIEGIKMSNVIFDEWIEYIMSQPPVYSKMVDGTFSQKFNYLVSLDLEDIKIGL